MVLKLDVYNPNSNNWINIGNLNPGDLPGSVSDNRPGKREVYIFECKQDNSKSVIYCSRSGIDAETGDARIINTSGVDVIKELKNGETYEMKIRTDKSLEGRLIRFTHLGPAKK